MTPSSPESSDQVTDETGYMAVTDHMPGHDINNEFVGNSSQANPPKTCIAYDETLTQTRANFSKEFGTSPNRTPVSNSASNTALVPPPKFELCTVDMLSPTNLSNYSSSCTSASSPVSNL